MMRITTKNTIKAENERTDNSLSSFFFILNRDLSASFFFIQNVWKTLCYIKDKLTQEGEIPSQSEELIAWFYLFWSSQKEEVFTQDKKARSWYTNHKTGQSICQAWICNPGNPGFGVGKKQDSPEEFEFYDSLFKSPFPGSPAARAFWYSPGVWWYSRVKQLRKCFALLNPTS